MATLFAFFGFVAPGLAFHLTLERRIPRRDETAFRETSLIALSSVAFTTVALAVLVLIRQAFPRGFPDLEAWEKAGWGYVAAHPAWTSATTALVPLIASGLAAAAAWVLTRGQRAELKNNGAWFQTLRLDRPLPKNPKGETFVWMHLRLKDEDEYWGNLRAYTEEDSAAVREIVLGGSTLLWKPKGAGSAEPMGHEWDAVIVNAEEISSIRLAYQDEDGDLRGRRTPARPHGRPLTTG